jgi:hypothetical protein
MGSGERPHGAAENIRPETTSGCANGCGRKFGVDERAVAAVPVLECTGAHQPGPNGACARRPARGCRDRGVAVSSQPACARTTDTRTIHPYSASDSVARPKRVLTAGGCCRRSACISRLSCGAIIAFVRAAARGVFVRRFARRVGYLVAPALEGGSNALQERPPPIE